LEPFRSAFLQQLPDALGFTGMALIATSGLLAAWRARAAAAA
jgi:hypothetical protein